MDSEFRTDKEKTERVREIVIRMANYRASRREYGTAKRYLEILEMMEKDRFAVVLYEDIVRVDRESRVSRV